MRRTSSVGHAAQVGPFIFTILTGLMTISSARDEVVELDRSSDSPLPNIPVHTAKPYQKVAESIFELDRTPRTIKTKGKAAHGNISSIPSKVADPVDYTALAEKSPMKRKAPQSKDTSSKRRNVRPQGLDEAEIVQSVAECPPTSSPLLATLTSSHINSVMHITDAIRRSSNEFENMRRYMRLTISQTGKVTGLSVVPISREDVDPTDPSIVNYLQYQGEAWVTIIDITKAVHPIIHASARRSTKPERRRIKDCIKRCDYDTLMEDKDMFLWMKELAAPSPMGVTQQRTICVLKWEKLEETLVAIMTKLGNLPRDHQILYTSTQDWAVNASAIGSHTHLSSSNTSTSSSVATLADTQRNPASVLQHSSNTESINPLITINDITSDSQSSPTTADFQWDGSPKGHVVDVNNRETASRTSASTLDNKRSTQTLARSLSLPLYLDAGIQTDPMTNVPTPCDSKSVDAILQTPPMNVQNPTDLLRYSENLASERAAHRLAQALWQAERSALKNKLTASAANLEARQLQKLVLIQALAEEVAELSGTSVEDVIARGQAKSIAITRDRQASLHSLEIEEDATSAQIRKRYLSSALSPSQYVGEDQENIRGSVLMKTATAQLRAVRDRVSVQDQEISCLKGAVEKAQVDIEYWKGSLERLVREGDDEVERLREATEQQSRDDAATLQHLTAQMNLLEDEKQTAEADRDQARGDLRAIRKRLELESVEGATSGWADAQSRRRLLVHGYAEALLRMEAAADSSLLDSLNKHKHNRQHAS